MESQTIEERKRTCRVCTKITEAYRCPGCERSLCSLKCFKDHRNAFKCEGTLNKRKFIKKKEMSIKTLRRDQRYLADEITKSNKVILVTIIDNILVF